jgi:ubiquinone/menaquinone biosynthesis C-methylase UbiE
VSGVDLTAAAIDHARARLELGNLAADDLRVSNAEKLDHPNDTFDLVYSWGVIHHSPSIEQALREIVRVTKPGGTVKLMLYNRRSLAALYIWLKWGLLRGHPTRSISNCLSQFVESPGTKAVTASEVRQMLKNVGVSRYEMHSVMTHQDKLDDHPRVRWLGHALSRVVDSDRFGWFLLIEFRKPE